MIFKCEVTKLKVEHGQRSRLGTKITSKSG